jgi:hypothetical protein
MMGSFSKMSTSGGNGDAAPTGLLYRGGKTCQRDSWRLNQAIERPNYSGVSGQVFTALFKIERTTEISQIIMMKRIQGMNDN